MQPKLAIFRYPYLPTLSLSLEESLLQCRCFVTIHSCLLSQCSPQTAEHLWFRIEYTLTILAACDACIEQTPHSARRISYPITMIPAGQVIRMDFRPDTGANSRVFPFPETSPLGNHLFPA